MQPAQHMFIEAQHGPCGEAQLSGISKSNKLDKCKMPCASFVRLEMACHVEQEALYVPWWWPV